MDGYSETVVEHFENPRNSGALEDPDGEAVRSNPAMRVHMMLRVKDGVIEDVKWQTKGCPASIASSSFASEMVRGWTIDAIEELGKDSVAEGLGGLPAAKMHCSALAADVLKAAVGDYRKKAAQSDSQAASV